MSPDILFDYQPLYRWLLPRLGPEGVDALAARVRSVLSASRHGDFSRWRHALESLPTRPPSVVDLNAACVRIGADHELSHPARAQFEDLLRAFHPWRKGPFCLYGVTIDTEWRSDWKWDRVKDHLSPLAGRAVLDVGCGNGYHCWRMRGAGAEHVVGIDPTLISVMQFHAVKRLVGAHPVFVLPLRLEELPEPRGLGLFDTVFSMGVIYHRRDPAEHLGRLGSSLRRGGELVLESLVVEGVAGEVLIPQGRYGRMANVHAIPTPQTLVRWVEQAGFHEARLIDVTPTTTQEQRSTEWMRFESLADCLDPRHPHRTVEGWPAPMRAIVIAQKP